VGSASGAGTYQSSFGSGGSGDGHFSHPAGVAVVGETILVVDEGNNRVQAFNKAGEYQSKFGSSGSGEGQLDRPTDIAADASGDLWVTDAENNRVEKFDSEGNFLEAVGSEGTASGQFSGPEGITADSEGHVWVADTYNGRVQELDEAGEVIGVLGSYGSGEGQLGEPVDVAAGPGGLVWVADWQNNRVSVFDDEGEFQFQLGSFGTGGGNFKHPDAIAIDSAGNVWVGDEGNDRVEQFDESGEFLGGFGSSGSGEGEFDLSYAFGIAADSESHVWVADPGNDRVQRWSTASVPTCRGGEASTEKNEALVLGAGAGALECESEEPLTYEVDTPPKHGELSSFNASTGGFTYVPESGFVGRDSFRFRASDPFGGSAPKTFWIQVGQVPLGEGIVAAYSFNEPSGETIYDAANGHDGTLYGPNRVQGKFGGALNFVAEDQDYASVPRSTAFNLIEAFTVEAWVRPRILSSYAPVLTKSEGPYEGIFELLAGGTEWGIPAAWIFTGGFTAEKAEGEAELPPETWTHLAMTYDGELLRLYIDGELVSSHPSPPPRENEGWLNIGIGASTNSAFDGKIDELRIYERVLGGAEIRTDMETPIEGTEESEDPEEPEAPEACPGPWVGVSGPGVEPEVPGLDIEVYAAVGSPPCAANGEQSRISKIEVSVDEEVVYSESRNCEGPRDPCSRYLRRTIQLPWTKVLGTSQVEVSTEDQLGNKAEPFETTETKPAEGTVSTVPTEAEDEVGSEGCKTPKNRYKHYVFVGNVVHGTKCADIMGAYPQHHTTVYETGTGDDVIRAGGEIDKIRAGIGDDHIYAGRGNDTVRGGAGDDQIDGGSGDDKLFGEGGNDLIAGTSGADYLHGEGGEDLLRGGGTADSLWGGADTDTLSFADAVTPGFEFGSFISGFPTTKEGRGIYLNLEQEPETDPQGHEYIRVFDGSTARFGGGVDKAYVGDGGFDNIIGSPFADYINGSATANLIDGGGGQDILKGNGGDDTIYGGAESDDLDGGADQSAGSLHGGEGDDVCANGGEVEPCKPDTAETIQAPSGGIAIGRLDPDDSAEDAGLFVRGTGERDVITASWNAGANAVDFTAKGTSFDTTLNGVSGCTVEAAVAQCPSAGVQTLVIDGGGNNDVLQDRNFPPSVSVTLLGGPDDDVLKGGISEDILVDGPGSGKDKLYGEGDDDTLMVSEGKDDAFGAAGSDLFVSGQICENEVISGGPGNDNASWAQLRGEAVGEETGEFKLPTDGVKVSIPLGESGLISRDGGSCSEVGHIKGIEFLEGSGGDDRLEGNDDHNIILGRSGEDELIGLDGADNMLANNRDPSGESEKEKVDHDKKIDCGAPEGGRHVDTVQADPADKSVIEEDCERVNPHAAPAQASRISGIGGDPTSEAPTMKLDEEVIGGAADPEATVPDALFQLDETEGTLVSNWSDEEHPGSFEGGPELDEPGAITESRGVHLDGEDDYIDLTDQWDPASFASSWCETVNGYSVEMWVKFDAATASGTEELFSRSEDGSGLFLYRSSDGRLNFMTEGGIEATTVSSEPVEDTEWHHVVVTEASETDPCVIISRAGVGPGWQVDHETPLMTLSVDGFPYVLGLDQEAPGGGVVSISADSLVGARETAEGPGDFLAGTVDDVALYGEPLEDAEIQTHALIGETPESGTVLLAHEGLEAPDEDEDGVSDAVDNCPATANADQEDADGDGVGDACQVEADSDEDGVADEVDNCPEDVNPLQEDADENGVGDACEPE
jgi:Ca2+-binding RTX toxin-like protein/streptogramin lyase